MKKMRSALRVKGLPCSLEHAVSGGRRAADQSGDLVDRQPVNVFQNQHLRLIRRDLPKDLADEDLAVEIGLLALERVRERALGMAIPPTQAIGDLAPSDSQQPDPRVVPMLATRER